ncbi:MAG: phosphotransferase [Gammaproteobacteria bacterium]|nr:phosphotransferase [Gammaproteobacteria bacterium]
MSDWLRNDLQLVVSRIVPASADASFRRYFRIVVDANTFVVMDAPPDKEDCRPFVEIAEALYGMGLNVPRIEQKNLDDGFLLLSDLGEHSYLSLLSQDTADELYRDAIDALITMQCAAKDNVLTLPLYDRSLLLGEMALFRDWLLGRHLGLSLNAEEQSMLESVFELLVNNVLTQPQVLVHRDYHSRNLMVCGSNPGILDFQDAVIGPISYDLVSLLRDCYVTWPQTQQKKWMDYYCDSAQQQGLLKQDQVQQFGRWFDLTGVQRHLKAAGIFARLYHRDGKNDYLADIPLTLNYICDVSGSYSELSDLAKFIQQRVLTSLS